MSASGSAQSRAPRGEPRTPGSCDNGLRYAGDPLAKHPIDAGLPRPRLWLAQVVRQPVRTRLRRIRRQCASRRRASSLNRGALGLRSEPAAALASGRNAEVGDERARRHSLTFQSTTVDRDVTYAGLKHGRPERHLAAQPSGLIRPIHSPMCLRHARPSQRSDSYPRVIGVGHVGSLADAGMEP